MKRNICIWFIAIILIAIAVYTGIDANNKTPESIAPSKANAATTSSESKAIDFTLTDLNGKKVSLKDFKGKNIFLNFWATWCPPCRMEMPDIEKIYQETKNKDLVILAVNIGEDKKTVKSFIKENNYNFSILLDSDQNVANQYGISAIPASYFIDKNGNIVAKKIGAMSLQQIKQYLKMLK